MKDLGEKPFRLAKDIGLLAIIASAISEEYGAGINAVTTSTLSVYPGAEYLVPLAVFLSGIILLPKVIMYVGFGKHMSKSGGWYVWMSRTLHPSIAFVVSFVRWVVVSAAMGIVAFTLGSFVAEFLSLLGVHGAVFLAEPLGRFLLGLSVIWVIFAIQFSGVRRYGILVSIVLILIFIEAFTIIVIGFFTPSSLFISLVSSKVHVTLSPPKSVGPVSASAVLGVMGLFLFSYSGLSGAPFLGGESKDAKKDMPRGILISWLTAVILYTLITLALFTVAPWWAVIDLLKSKASYFATAPGIVSLVAPNWVGLLLTGLVSIIVAKTIAPIMMEHSRLLFAWSQDGILPKSLTHVNRFRAPDVALFISSLLATVFLTDFTFINFNIGLVMSAVALMLLIAFLGAGVIVSSMRRVKRDWEKRISSLIMLVGAVGGIIIAAIIIPSVIFSTNVPFYFQPWFQLVISIIVAIVIYVSAELSYRRNGRSLSREIMEKLPPE
ncbi:amino acid transporter [Metallosphaera yellowstonensis MK1]|jgi:amino acid transporter|uniref:Amino acid transporter n=1 Tax=Metallosphaera yellowstonensis MK1 TaxID=671065 RepID=H2C1W7_9CREN|nr:APC family permease [Metallosphaera yellowstonensis]EHP70238.1 amino acid transporter [Metallosphaera yellowstonensis MK1]